MFEGKVHAALRFISQDTKGGVISLDDLVQTGVDPKGLFAFVACRLIPLNKNPGVRPIGIGEVP